MTAPPAFEAPHGLGVDRRHIVDLEMRMAGRLDAGRLVDVLQPDRDAVHRPRRRPPFISMSACRAAFSATSAVTSDVAREVAIDGGNARQERFGERGRGEFAARHQAAGLGDAERREIARRDRSWEGPIRRRGRLAAVRGPGPALGHCAPSGRAGRHSPCAGGRYLPRSELRPVSAARARNLIERWRLGRRCHEILRMSRACNRHAASFVARYVALSVTLAWPLHDPGGERLPVGIASGAPN